MVKRDIPYSNIHSNKLDLYQAEDSDAPLFIFFHGGGLEGCNKGDGKIHYFLDLMNSGISVATADYRMYPNAKFPDFLSDAAECVKWCIDNVPHSQIFIGGSSAGGYITMMLAFDKSYLGKHGIDSRNKDEIAGYFCDSGQPTVHFNVLRERGLDTRLVRIDEAAPIYFIEQVNDTDKLPRYVLITSEFDMENRPEQTRLMHRTMLHLGYPADKVEFVYMKGYGHTEYNDAVDTDGKPLYAKMIRRFINGEKTI